MKVEDRIDLRKEVNYVNDKSKRQASNLVSRLRKDKQNRLDINRQKVLVKLEREREAYISAAELKLYYEATENDYLLGNPVIKQGRLNRVTRIKDMDYSP